MVRTDHQQQKLDRFLTSTPNNSFAQFKSFAEGPSGQQDTLQGVLNNTIPSEISTQSSRMSTTSSVRFVSCFGLCPTVMLTVN